VNLAGAASDYTLDLAALTSDRGNYVLSLVATGSGITDLAGNPLAADANDEWRMNPWHNFTDALNADVQPGVFAIVALVVFNELNNRLLSDPVTGLLPPSVPSPAFYRDVNDDGFITEIDALLKINDINLRPEGEGEFVPELAPAGLDGSAPPRSSAGQTEKPAAHSAAARGRFCTERRFNGPASEGDFARPAMAGGDRREPARIAGFRSIAAVAIGASQPLAQGSSTQVSPLGAATPTKMDAIQSAGGSVPETERCEPSIGRKK
jgi:hypothetical protein